MSDRAHLEQLETEPGAGRAPAGVFRDLRRLSDVPVDLTVEIGRTRLTVGETLALRQGSIVSLDRMAGEPVDLLVNGAPIARGEVVVIDEQFGLRITDVLGSGAAGRAQTPVPAAPVAAGPNAAAPTAATPNAATLDTADPSPGAAQ